MLEEGLLLEDGPLEEEDEIVGSCELCAPDSRPLGSDAEAVELDELLELEELLELDELLELEELLLELDGCDGEDELELELEELDGIEGLELEDEELEVVSQPTNTRLSADAHSNNRVELLVMRMGVLLIVLNLLFLLILSVFSLISEHANHFLRWTLHPPTSEAAGQQFYKTFEQYCHFQPLRLNGGLIV